MYTATTVASRSRLYLDTLYILTNNKTGWINTMIPFSQTHGWYNVVTTQDSELDEEWKEGGMAVSTEYAHKAAVFIGNRVHFQPISSLLCFLVLQLENIYWFTFHS